MNFKKILPVIFVGLLAILAVVLVAKLISGAASIITGAFNAILGLVVIVALVIIVVWMFRYARKNK